MMIMDERYLQAILTEYYGIETIPFALYMAMGFRPSAHSIPSSVRKEPFDIQMKFPIII